MNKQIIFIFFSLTILQSISFPQIDTSETNKEEIINEIISENEATSGNEGLGDLIEELTENPVNINTADISELQTIPNLSLAEAKAIINYREKNGIFFSTSELNLVEGLSKQTIKNVTPFITIKEKSDISGNNKVKGFPLNVEFRNRIIDRLQQVDGISRNKFQGNRYKSYSRLKLRYNEDIRFGALIEKDPGEKSLNDMTSAHLSISDLGIADKIIIGDYILEFGQGLAIWGPYSFSKSSNAIYPVKKKPKIIREYTSSDENRFFRGVSAKFRYNNYSLSLFYSKNNFDAGIDPLTNNILSTPVDGYHRTETEIAKKNAAAEQTFGGILEAQLTPEINLGLLVYHSSFNHKFIPNNLYDLNGDKFNFYSFSYNIYYDNMNLFGENSFNGKSLASNINLQIDLSKDFSIISSLRNYPRNYFNLHSNGFGEQNGKTQNEFGIYNGIKWRTDFGIINFYFDQFSFPFATYYNPLPTSGNELMIDYFVRPIKHLSTRLRIKNENKELTFKNSDKKEIYKRRKLSVRFETIFTLSKRIRLKNRIEFNSYKISELNENETGYMAFQDIRFLPIDNLYLAARIMFFKTDSFNTAVYEFENDLDGVFALSSLYGQGMRWYALVKYKPFNFLKISLKYSEIYKPMERSLGSGYSEINGNIDNRLSLQIDFDI